MKRTAIFLFVLTSLFSCKNGNEKYDKVYSLWKNEMAEINKGHSEALTVLDGFQQKIDGHKKRLAEFTTYINSETSKGTENVSKLEEEIVKKRMKT